MKRNGRQMSRDRKKIKYAAHAPERKSGMNRRLAESSHDSIKVA